MVIVSFRWPADYTICVIDTGIEIEQTKICIVCSTFKASNLTSVLSYLYQDSVLNLSLIRSLFFMSNLVWNLEL